MARPTKETEREYRRRYRAKQQAKAELLVFGPNGALPGMPNAPQALDEALDEALEKMRRLSAKPRRDAIELTLSTLDAARWPDLASSALALAEVLDAPELQPRATAVRQLGPIMETIRNLAEKADQAKQTQEDDAHVIAGDFQLGAIAA